MEVKILCETFYEKLLVFSNILMVVLVEHLFAKPSIWFFFFLTTLALIELDSLY